MSPLNNITLEFRIDGKVVSEHRRIVSNFYKDRYGNRRRRPAPMTFIPKEYRWFKKKVAQIALVAREKSDYNIPVKGCRVRMFVHYTIATHIRITPKGKKSYLRERVHPDDDNANKCLKDALQGILFHNDRDCVCVPFPDKGVWFTSNPGLDEWIDVAIEIMDDPSGKQIPMELSHEEPF